MELSDSFQKNLKFLGITLIIAGAIIGFNNLMTPDEYPDVGFTQLESECAGLEAGGVCLGIQHQDHEVLNFDDWESIEEGTENHRRMVESELMLRAYDECRSENVSGMDWTGSVEFENRTADDWEDEVDNVTLLPCEETFYFSLED